MKNLFSSSKKVEKIDNGEKFLEIVRNSGASNSTISLITQNGMKENEILKSLKKILFFQKKSFNSLSVENIASHTAFQIARLCNCTNIIFTYNPQTNLDKYVYETKIKFKIEENSSKQDNTLYVYQKGQNKNEYPSVVINETSQENCFINFTENNIGELLNKIISNSSNIIGFCSSSSVLDARNYCTKQIFYNICKTNPIKIVPAISETEMMMKMQNPSKMSMNFNELLFSLEKMDELMSSGMLKQFGIDSNPEMNKIFNKQKAIINSMTDDEKKHPNKLNPQRINRIAKGAGCKIEEVLKLIEMITSFAKNGGAMASKLMSNPNALFNGFGKK